jgi:peptidoglycan/LPS O-acetylase OafA/YrhL
VKTRKAAFIFLAIALLCAIINWIYGRYSHGVHSDYMTFMFAYPLLGGAAVYLLIGTLSKARLPGRFAINIYNSGIATLTVGSALSGVFAIAGTSSPYQPVFMIAGIAMVSLGVLCYFITGLKNPKH